MGVEFPMNYSVQGRRLNLFIVNKKKTCQLRDITDPVHHGVKLEKEK